MHLIRFFSVASVTLFWLTLSSNTIAKEFDTDKLMSDIESQLKFSSDKLTKLKPAIDAKSKELEKSINESVNKGFVELQALTGQLDVASKEAEEKLKQALNGDEMEKLKTYLKSIDQEAISQIKDSLVDELSKLLLLTQDQIGKLRPILIDSFDKLGAMLDRLASQGKEGLEAFKQNFDQINNELKNRVSKVLSSDQLKKLDANREELRQKLRAELSGA